MIKYATIINEETKLCNVGDGTDAEFYKSIGMVEMEVEQAYNGDWYLKGYAPEKPVEIMKSEKDELLAQYINAISWRVERYNTQKELGIETTDTAVTYILILEYMQYCRSFNEQAEYWILNPQTFEEWIQNG